MRSDAMLWVILGAIALVVMLLVYNHDSGQTLGLDNGSFSTIAYVGIIGTVIGLGLVTRARPGSDFLRQIAIWLAIFVALVVGYRLWNGEPTFPDNQPVVPDSGTGISVFLMDGVDSGLHLRRPRYVG